MSNRMPAASHNEKQKDQLPLAMPVEPEQVVDTRVCYLCQRDATATCAQCKMPVCEEHRHQVQEYVTRVSVTLCDECADHYDGVIMPH